MRFGGETVADTRDAILLRQHGFLPVFWLPGSDVRTRSARAERLDDGVALPRHGELLAPARGRARGGERRVDVRRAARGVARHCAGTSRSTSTRWTPGTRRRSASTCTRATPTCAPTRAAARATSSSRSAASQVAETRRPVLLDETGLITRYYIPLADVRHELLVPSRDVHGVPVQGPLRLLVGARGRRARARRRLALRRCRCPTSPPIAGHLCFWQEREDTRAARRRRGPAAAARRARRRRRRGAAAVARAPRDAAAREHARRAGGRAAARLARARTTAPRARRTASWTWRTSAPAARRLWRY